MKRVLVPTKELKGKPGKIWNGMALPAGGKSSFTIEDDFLVAKAVTTFGLETKTTYAKLADIGSIELCQGRLWWLIGFGITIISFASGIRINALALLGLFVIVLFFFLKQRSIVVYCKTVTLILFYEKQPDAEAFKDTLLAEIITNNQQDRPSAKQPRKSPGLSQKKPKMSKKPESQGK